MRILGIDTALGACSAAVLEGGAVLARARQGMDRGHAEALAPMVEAVMQDAQLPFAKLDRLAVTTGPGTFTGQRVGLAFARAMALALKIPAAGITTLDAMAAEALAGGGEWAAAIIDAKRGEAYLGARSAAGETLIEPVLIALEDAAGTLAALGEKHGGEVVLAGSGAAALIPLLEKKRIAMQLSQVRQPDAVFVARLGASALAPEGAPAPLYLRPPDAKLPAARR